MMHVGKMFKKRWQSLFIEAKSDTVEFFSGVLSLGASIGPSMSNKFWFLYVVSAIVGVWQIASLIPFYNLRSRHYSNMMMCLISIVISYENYKIHGIAHDGTGGYFIVAIMSGWCAFVTQMDRNSIKNV